jgi:predicted pyridoxine 5'-phosphate oxidase superfamily flavin-nucleotide-binding protein
MAEAFHEGEIAIQKQTEERGTAMLNGGMLADNIPPGAVPFISQQYYALFSSPDPQGDIWISMLTGKQGFARSTKDRKGVALALPAKSALADDPVFSHVKNGAPIGGLFIELATRRRLRVNGTMQNVTDKALTIDIEQAYPNCPKYIQRRAIDKVNGTSAGDFNADSGSGLNAMGKSMIEQADTLFVGSGDHEGHFDASQRGGMAGFVDIMDDNVLRIPDYPGNSMFNTFGNFHVNPKGALLFIDYQNNTQLHLTGVVALEFDKEDEIQRTAGSGRWWTFTVKSWCTSALAHDLDWRFVDYSPFNPKS